jgi:hypothetical protein
MFTINTFVDCPADCDEDNLLPAIPEIQDCTNYEQVRSQVHTIYLMPQVAGVSSADPFTNFATTPTVTASAVDNTNADNTKAKFLVGEGGIAAPTETLVEYPMLGEKVEERLYELVFNVKNLVDAQYEFLQQLQCGNIDITFYYASGMAATQYVYGVQGGIEPRRVTVTFPKGGGKDDRDLAIITIAWLAKGDPFRRANPYA